MTTYLKLQTPSSVHMNDSGELQVAVEGGHGAGNKWIKAMGKSFKRKANFFFTTNRFTDHKNRLLANLAGDKSTHSPLAMLEIIVGQAFVHACSSTTYWVNEMSRGWGFTWSCKRGAGKWFSDSEGWVSAPI